MIKVAFFGTPNIGASALKSLIQETNIKIEVVVTNKDKPIGRSHSKLEESPVAILAKKHKLNLIKTNSINKDIFLLKKYNFDYIVTCAFGQLLSDEVLKLPNKKSINIHGSLLPEGRGGAPIHWSIINGKKETGISIMEMVSEMDAGDYFLQYKLKIDENDCVDDIFKKMSILIKNNTAISILKIDQGIKPIKQDLKKVSYWMNIKKSDSKIDFNNLNFEVHNKIRGLNSKPGSWCLIENKIIKIHKSYVYNKKNNEKSIGKIFKIDDNGAYVNCKNNTTIILGEVTIEGEKRHKISTLSKNKFLNKILY